MGGVTRIGLFGGTFDPPHYGHLIAAQEVHWRLGLDRVLFLPARQNPLKQGQEISPAEDRLRMVELAVADDDRFEASRLDMDRPPPSYTVHLLRLVREQYGPDAALYFIAGADILHELERWFQPDEILRLARLVAITRPGWHSARHVGGASDGLDGGAERILRMETPSIDISATDNRARVREGAPIRYLLPRAVEAYVRERGLYAAAPVESSR